jgi:glutamate--cysteine ligase
MRERKLPFFRLAMAYSKEWAQHFRERTITAERQAAFEQETQRSLMAQKQIEQADDISFEQYLDDFFAQYDTL